MISSKEFFTQFLTSSCNKHYPADFKHYKNVRDNLDVIYIRSTILYDIYKMLVDKEAQYSDFYTEAKKMLYYDKYICSHGTEFYYLIQFNREHYRYSEVLEALAKASSPMYLKDVEQIIPAVCLKEVD